MRAGAVVQHHADELHVFAHRGVQAVAAHVHGGRIGQRQHGQRRQLAVGRAVVDGHAAAAHGFGHAEADVLHAQRAEDPLGHHRAQALAALLFDDTAQPVDVGPVGPGGARLVHQHGTDGGKVAAHHRRDALGRAVGQVVGAKKLIRQARGVQHQVVDGDRALGRAGAGLAGGVKAVQHLQLVDLGHVAAGGVVQADLAFFHQLHHACAGQRLGGREDGEHRVGGHGLVLAQLARAGRAFVEVAVAVGDHGDDAGYAAVALGGLGEQRVQRRRDGALWHVFVSCFWCGFAPPGGPASDAPSL